MNQGMLLRSCQLRRGVVGSALESLWHGCLFGTSIGLADDKSLAAGWIQESQALGDCFVRRQFNGKLLDMIIRLVGT
jgi:hypothetical protein